MPKKSMFFERLSKDRGKDWLQSVAPEELNPFSISFFKDLAYGSIDKTLWGAAFFDERFMYTMLNRAKNEYWQEYYTRCALTALPTNPSFAGVANDINYQEALSHHMRREQAMGIIATGLEYISNNQQPASLGMLDWISTNAKQYKYDI